MYQYIYNVCGQLVVLDRLTKGVEDYYGGAKVSKSGKSHDSDTGEKYWETKSLPNTTNMPSVDLSTTSSDRINRFSWGPQAVRRLNESLAPLFPWDGTKLAQSADEEYASISYWVHYVHTSFLDVVY